MPPGPPSARAAHRALRARRRSCLRRLLVMSAQRARPLKCSGTIQLDPVTDIWRPSMRMTDAALRVCGKLSPETSIRRVALTLGLAIAVLVGVFRPALVKGEGAPPPTRSAAAGAETNQRCVTASDCKGPLSDICKMCGDDRSRCDHWTCSGGKCEAEICPAPAPVCRTMSDCKGPLPRICRRCADGTLSCTKWACLSGQCQVQVCPK
jgi:hypothetical protein